MKSALIHPPSIQYITSVLSLNKVLEVIYEETNELRGCVNGKEDSRNENPLFSTRTRARTEMGRPTGV